MPAAMPAESAKPTVPCAACAGQAHADEAVRPHHAPHNDQTYDLQRCPVCGLQFWWPLKADPSVYETEGFEAYVDYHSGARPFPRWSEPLFHSLNGSGTALDIGCGDGAVLSRLAAAGFDPHGIDLDTKSVRVAREKFGLRNVTARTLDDYAAECARTGIRFDLITFFEVLEHQDSPRGFLSQVAALGNEGCSIAGSVPNRDRFLARLDRRLSDGDLPPHHFLWFSENSLASLLTHAGFEEVSISKVGALPFSSIVTKLRAIVARKASSWPIQMRWVSKFLELMTPLLAIVPWVGMRAAPSHLFFKCRTATKSTA